ncbi:putative glucooligosaccharide oxidase [Penicillium brasilianum]|uniref:Putative glucooligosaccharide oxidase n=1 Tax=Penicillium brasilianum TaxID=104259 RepID=A0A1S9RH44_PENBI|nr:putative glucooligosaccharide oxidase [Penicillium brasilianum]
MGIAHSIPGQDCLLAAVGHNSRLVAFQDDAFFHLRTPPVYNLDRPVTPIAVTFPENSEQVASIVRCAASNGYKVQARSGGHSYGNYGLGGVDGEVVVDLKNLQDFSMDPSSHIATFGSGTLLGDLHSRLYNAGKRAVAHGACLSVGMGGHFTIGGLGTMSRQWGMALDHIREVEVVLANGTIVNASDSQNQDVLFAIKGAAASFGIVTKFKLTTHPAPTQAVQFSYTLNLGSTAERARLFKDWQRFIFTKNLTRQVSSELVVFELGILLSGTFFGSLDEWKSLEKELDFPAADKGSVIILTDWLGMIASQAEDLIVQVVGGIASAFYAKSMSFTDAVPDEGIDSLFNYLASAMKGTPAWFIIFDLEAGAINDVPVNATAYAHRETIMWMQSYAVSLLGPVSQTTKGFLNGINNVVSTSRPGAVYGAYPGYVDPLLENAQEAYWGSNLPRLQSIKAQVDPMDIFHNPQSVQVVLDHS